MAFKNEFELKPPVDIPVESLSSEALNGIIESFILREGTDYGAVEISFERKKEQLRKQIEKKETRVVFDPNSESVTLMSKR